MKSWSWEGPKEGWVVAWRSNANDLHMQIVERVTLRAPATANLESMIPRWKESLDWMLKGTFIVDQNDPDYEVLYGCYQRGGIRLRQLDTFPRNPGPEDLVTSCWHELRRLALEDMGAKAARETLACASISLRLGGTCYEQAPGLLLGGPTRGPSRAF